MRAATLQQLYPLSHQPRYDYSANSEEVEMTVGISRFIVALPYRKEQLLCAKYTWPTSMCSFGPWLFRVPRMGLRSNGLTMGTPFRLSSFGPYNPVK